MAKKPYTETGRGVETEPVPAVVVEPIPMTRDGLDECFSVLTTIHGELSPKKQDKFRPYLVPVADLLMRVKIALFPMGKTDAKDTKQES